MAIPVHSLGDFTFCFWRNFPADFPRPVGELVTHPGVDGVGVLDIGDRPQPFRAVSHVDCEDYDAAWSLWESYRGLILQATQPVVVSDHAFDDDGYRFLVLDVRALTIKRCGQYVGGTVETPGAILECVWTLLAYDHP